MADEDMSAAPAADDQAGAEEQGGDLSQGYCLELSVMPDGTFKVSGPEPLEEEAKEEQGAEPGSEEGQDYDSIGEALKAILQAVRSNPVGGDSNKQFDAGYQAG